MKIKTITAQELIEALQELEPDTPVVFSSNYGDRGQTQQIHKIYGQINEMPIYESAYSDSGWAIKRFGDEEAKQEYIHVIE